MKRSSTDTCCLTLPLKTEKWQEDRLTKRFEIARQIYNSLLGIELKKLRKLEQTPEYKALQEKILSLDWKNPKHKSELNKLYNQKKKLLDDAGIRNGDFEKDVKEIYKHFNNKNDDGSFKSKPKKASKKTGKSVASNVAVHGIAAQVWQAFEKMLYSNGKQVHFKKKGDIYSLRGYSAKNSSGVEIIFRGDHIEWNGLRLPLKLDPKNAYEAEMLDKRVKFVRILRKPGKSKDRWYAQLALEGKPAIKRDATTGMLVHPVGHGTVGLDIGPQTLAYSSADTTDLLELADQVENIEHEKRLLQRKMDRSRRAMNPDNYNKDGTIKRGVKLTRNKSKRYCRLQKELAYIQHCQAETRKRQHTELANHLLSLGDCFYVEDMSWPALAHRAKETEISAKTGKFKRKKRFGKSIADKAPATLIGILQQKCISLGLPGILKVPLSLKASQYNHITKEYISKELSQRWNTMPDGKRIQRDLYSAFLLQHYDPTTESYNQNALEQNYPQFLKLHDQTIQRLSAMPKTVASMGIRRSVS